MKTGQPTFFDQEARLAFWMLFPTFTVVLALFEAPLRDAVVDAPGAVEGDGGGSEIGSATGCDSSGDNPNGRETSHCVHSEDLLRPRTYTRRLLDDARRSGGAGGGSSRGFNRLG